MHQMKTRRFVWLSVLGPSATWTWQRLARHATHIPGTAIDTTDLAVSIGLGEGLGRTSPLSRTLNRLVVHHAAYCAGHTLAVRVALPDLWTPRHPPLPLRPHRPPPPCPRPPPRHHPSNDSLNHP
jgi:hypothetical protein